MTLLDRESSLGCCFEEAQRRVWRTYSVGGEDRRKRGRYVEKVQVCGLRGGNRGRLRLSYNSFLALLQCCCA